MTIKGIDVHFGKIWVKQKKNLPKNPQQIKKK
jgi:hypothetical protein